MNLKVITPTKLAKEMEVASLTLPTASGEITILPKHANLFSLLTEGVITIRTEKDEEYMAIGGGYLETNGKEIRVLVSRAYNQEEIDEEITKKAMERAQKLLEETKDKKERFEASALLRRSLVDMKLLRKIRRGKSS